MSPTSPSGRKKPEITPSVAKRASSSPLRMRTSTPASAAIAATSCAPFDARRMASVAVASSRATPMASAMARNRRTASTVRRNPSGAMAPVCASPSPSRQRDFSLKRGRGARPSSS